MNCSHGMDGEKYNEVISTAWSCLLLWHILIVIGVYEQEGAVSTAWSCLLLWHILIVIGVYEQEGAGERRKEGGEYILYSRCP